jgi:hypothetical protein
LKQLGNEDKKTLLEAAGIKYEHVKKDSHVIS